ncbi:MAG: hypothetical protein WA294_17750 [Acidobacteriaceae bacterium]
MPTECAFTLPAGQKCHCMATRNHHYCRHHGAPASRKPRRHPDAWCRRAAWRDLGRRAASMPRKEAVLQALNVLDALRENRIADRTAGRLLRALLMGWDELPLMPMPKTGWVLREPDALSTPPFPSLPPAPVAPAAPQPAAARQPLAPPADEEVPSLEEMRRMVDDLLKKLDENPQ